MGNLKASFVGTDGKEYLIDDIEPGQSLMEAAKLHGVAGIMGDCLGSCACATCHVYVDPAWAEKAGAPDDIEAAMLDMVADIAKDNSRLSCQIRMNADLDGIKMTVAPSAY